MSDADPGHAASMARTSLEAAPDDAVKTLARRAVGDSLTLDAAGNRKRPERE
jgi:hypothetical protein